MSDFVIKKALQYSYLVFYTLVLFWFNIYDFKICNYNICITRNLCTGLELKVEPQDTTQFCRDRNETICRKRNLDDFRRMAIGERPVPDPGYLQTTPWNV